MKSPKLKERTHFTCGVAGCDFHGEYTAAQFSRHRKRHGLPPVKIGLKEGKTGWSDLDGLDRTAGGFLEHDAMP